MTHVFVVDDTTFKYHLEYMFAGTGAKDKLSTFLTAPQVQMFPSPTERNLVSMIADISRVRVGDNIIFYLQATKNHEGMFFGVFCATSDAFFDENDEKNYLMDKLHKGLSFRVLIEPKEVYSVGVTEHELLDDIGLWRDSYRLCWSLIYRKLKGNRGCTMIMDYEYKNLLTLLQAKNHDVVLSDSGFTYDMTHSTIINASRNNYKGRQNSIDITDRLLYKALGHKAFECHLQTFIIQQLASKERTMYELFDIDPNIPIWLGNEVACGVGMQRIDILIIQEIDKHVKIIPIELKDEEPYPNVFDQIDWYVKWIRQYVVPNYCARDGHLEIIPYIVAKEKCSLEFLDALKDYETKHNRSFSISPCHYIGFKIDNNGIVFNQQV